MIADTLTDILTELDRAETLHPSWPTDIVHQTAIMTEEAGETLRAALNAHYHGGKVEEVRMEAVQTGAMVLRLLLNLEGK